MVIDTVIFDLGNVLLKFDMRIIAGKIAERFPLDENKLFDLFFDSPLVGLHDDGKIDGREFHRRAMKLLDIDMPFEEFRDIWNDIFTENEEVINLADSLSSRYKVFLMSNTNRMHFEYIKTKFRMVKIFDTIFTSYEVGERKPHPKIFNAAIKCAGTKPDHVVFIDDRQDLVEGAQKLGIHGIQFRDIRQLKADLAKYGVEVK